VLADAHESTGDDVAANEALETAVSLAVSTSAGSGSQRDASA